MSSTLRPRRAVWATIALFVLGCPSWVRAAKPQPPPPPPPANVPGLIFHDRSDGPWAVRADDTGATPVAGSVPCFFAQGPDRFHDRWYLTLQQTGEYDLVTYVSQASGQVVTNGPWPHYDLFAYRSSPGNPTQMVQLTDLFGILRVPNDAAWYTWSPDSNEDPQTSFVAVRGHDIRSSFEDVDGETWYDRRESPEYDLRLPLMASEITSGWLNDDFVPYRPADPGDLDVFLKPVGTTTLATTTLNGDYLLFTTSNRRLLLLDPDDPDVNNPHSVVWDGNTEGEPSNFHGSWFGSGPTISPDGRSVAGVNVYSDARGGVWVLSLDRSFQPRQIVKNSQKNAQNWTRYETAFFSPDSQFILSSQTINKNGSFSGDRIIFPAAGGAAVRTLHNVNQWVTRWVSEDLAP